MLLRVPGIAQAVVDTYELRAGDVEFVAYYSLRSRHRGRRPRTRLRAAARAPPRLHGPRLPRETRDDPDDCPRQGRPRPAAADAAARLLARTAPRGPGHRRSSANSPRRWPRCWIDQVSVETHFFEELGANSLLMAQFCARCGRPELPAVSMRDVYLHPTVARAGRRHRSAATG